MDEEAMSGGQILSLWALNLQFCTISAGAAGGNSYSELVFIGGMHLDMCWGFMPAVKPTKAPVWCEGS